MIVDDMYRFRPGGTREDDPEQGEERRRKKHGTEEKKTQQTWSTEEKKTQQTWSTDTEGKKTRQTWSTFNMGTFVFSTTCARSPSCSPRVRSRRGRVEYASPDDVRCPCGPWGVPGGSRRMIVETER